MAKTKQRRTGKTSSARSPTQNAKATTPKRQALLAKQATRIVKGVGARSWVICGLLASLLFGLGMAESRGGDPVTSQLNAELIANPGTATFSILPEINVMPVLCGCDDPAAFQDSASTQSWGGALIPAASFDLSVSTDHGLPWQLSMYAPDTGPSNWMKHAGYTNDVTVAIHARNGQRVIARYEMRVRHTRRGEFDLPFGVGEVTLVVGSSIHITPVAPVVSLLPAADSKTTVASIGGARSYAASFMTIESRVPAREASSERLARGRTPESVFRGDTLDSPGGAKLDFVADAQTQLFIGTHAIDLRPGKRVTLRIRPSAFSLRLLPSPLTGAGLERLSRERSADRAEGMNPGVGSASRHVFTRPTEALPPYDVELAHAVSPTQDQWAAILRKATPRPKSMWGTGWPPLPEERQVDVFGSITELSGNSLVGSVNVGGDVHPIVKGDVFAISSIDGLSAEPFTPVLHLSSGSTAATTSLSGTAVAMSDGQSLAVSQKPTTMIAILVGVIWVLVGMLFDSLLVRRGW